MVEGLVWLKQSKKINFTSDFRIYNRDEEDELSLMNQNNILQGCLKRTMHNEELQIANILIFCFFFISLSGIKI